MVDFLSFILFVVLAFYLLGIVGRWFLRRWITRRQREFERAFGGHGASRPGSAGNRGGRDGEVRVNAGSSAPRRVRSDVGEYVEYEEYGAAEETIDEA